MLVGGIEEYNNLDIAMRIYFHQIGQSGPCLLRSKKNHQFIESIWFYLYLAIIGQNINLEVIKLQKS